MYLFYILICYATTLIISVNTYVLLAANLDDFRTMAKKFVPENLADEILQMASETGFKSLRENLDIKEEEPTQYSASQEQSYEITTQPSFQQQQQRSRPGIESKRAPPPSINIDEIVEKVKQKLYQELMQQHYQRQQDQQQNQQQNLQQNQQQNQLLQNQQQQNQQLNNQQLQNQQLRNQQQQLMPPAVPQRNVQLADKPVTVLQSLVYDNTVAPSGANAAPIYDDPSYEENSYEETELNVKVPVQYQGQNLPNQKQMLQNKRISTPNIRNKNLLKHGRYTPQQIYGNVASFDSTQNLGYVPQGAGPPQNIPKPRNVVQQKRYQLKKLTIRPKFVASGNLVRKPNQPAPRQVTKKQVANTENVGGIYEAVDMLKSNDSYEDYVTPPKDEAFVSEEGAETISFAPVIITMRNQPTIRMVTVPTVPVDGALDEGQEIPLAAVADATDGVEDYYEPTESTPKEMKARTESLSYEETETKADLNATTTEVTIKGKKVTKKSKIGTMIPTRETFKINSPNYYGKLPTVAEKYNFNEPIPEQDREPENLKPIGNPPASINGKVILS